MHASISLCSYVYLIDCLYALDEIFASAGRLIQDTRAAQEMRALDKFTQSLDRAPDRVAYGMREVSKADELLAVDTLLVSDSLFRSQDMGERHSYVQLVESVRAHGGKARIFSSSHTSGEKLKYYTGIAAILWCSIPDLDEMVQEISLVVSVNTFSRSICRSFN